MYHGTSRGGFNTFDSEIYKKDDDNYLIITEMKDSDGNDIIIPVKIDGKGNYNDVYIDENQIQSVYGKRNLAKYLEANGFEQIYKKRETALNEGVQYSNISNFSEGSIPQSESNVNSSSENSDNVNSKFSLSDTNGRKLTEGQQEYFKDFVVRDEDGSLNRMAFDNNIPTANLPFYKNFSLFSSKKSK